MIIAAVAVVVIAVGLTGCNEGTPQSASGVQKATVTVPVDPQTGMTVEQQNIANRLQMDNKPGSVKHLYVISPETGQVLIYSTVKGKVTSSGKRLSPKTINNAGAQYGFKVPIGRDTYYTNEVLEDDGTYGSSVEYIYWWDTAGRYHQHFFTGGQILHISDYPITVKSVILNLEVSNAPEQK
jgi:hypothetical protein